MNKTLLACLLLAGTAFAATAQNAQNNNCQKRTIEVNGYAKADVAPDLFTVGITYGETKEFLGKVKLDETEKSLLDALKKAGIPSDSLRVVQIANNTTGSKTPLIIKQVKFTTGDFSKINALSQNLNFKGFYNISILEAKYSKKDEILGKLRSEALSNAMGKAAGILKNSANKLGEILTINDFGSNDGNAYRTRMNFTMLSMAQADTKEAAPESVDIYQNITFSSEMKVVFEIVK